MKKDGSWMHYKLKCGVTLRDRWHMERKAVNNGHYLRVALERCKSQDAGTLKKEI